MPQPNDHLSKIEHDIRVVMDERKEMVKVGQQILMLLGKYPYKPETDKTEIQKKLLEFMAHLSNVGGFCDNGWRRAIFDIETMLGLSALSLNFDLSSAPNLVTFLSTATMIQVDFTKRPFRLVGFDIKAFQTRFRAILKRGR